MAAGMSIFGADMFRAAGFQFGMGFFFLHKCLSAISCGNDGLSHMSSFFKKKETVSIILEALDRCFSSAAYGFYYAILFYTIKERRNYKIPVTNKSSTHLRSSPSDMF
jgi:hypothetical protein